ncbi:MAG: carboxypeptidase-like regulatory domain-containing protein, partial [Bacteroidales bacterium]|nr:carboxypeptidase-like regulatory domain-containing protein [Bacteroidales bacterium]
MNRLRKFFLVVAFLAGVLSPLGVPYAWAQKANVTYKGKVVDSQTGEPLPGAAVLLKGSHRWDTSADKDGNF